MCDLWHQSLLSRATDIPQWILWMNLTVVQGSTPFHSAEDLLCRRWQSSGQVYWKARVSLSIKWHPFSFFLLRLRHVLQASSGFSATRCGGIVKGMWNTRTRYVWRHRAFGPIRLRWNPRNTIYDYCELSAPWHWRKKRQGFEVAGMLHGSSG